jgi:GNAT superfamily N-acetyltransferase
VSRDRLHIDRLTAEHDVSTFDCGVAEVDDWIRRYAVAAQVMDSARTFVAVQGTVIGYFSLTMGSVRKKDAPQKLVRGLPGYPVGMVLLARLAVDKKAQGDGIGTLLLAEALRRAVAAGEAAAARLVVVDAIDDNAEAFYRHFGFLPAPEHPHRLFRRMKDIRASLDEAGPALPEQRRLGDTGSGDTSG